MQKRRILDVPEEGDVEGIRARQVFELDALEAREGHGDGWLAIRDAA
jgi:hypothetical protein